MQHWIDLWRECYIKDTKYIITIDLYVCMSVQNWWTRKNNASSAQFLYPEMCCGTCKIRYSNQNFRISHFRPSTRSGPQMLLLDRALIAGRLKRMPPYERNWNLKEPRNMSQFWPRMWRASAFLTRFLWKPECCDKQKIKPGNVPRMQEIPSEPSYVSCRKSERNPEQTTHAKTSFPARMLSPFFENNFGLQLLHDPTRL